MSRSLAQLQAHTRETVFTVLVALGVILAVGSGFIAWFARGLGRPIAQMRDFAVALGRGELGTRLAIARPDELGELAAELNRMAERLGALEQERRSFLANASHELRTPVSNLRVTLQALDDGAGDDPELRARFLRTAVDETTRLGSLIQDLLDLGHLEAGAARLDRHDVPLRPVLERATRAIEGRALDRRVSLLLDLDEDLTVNIDPERIAQALLCVLDNALKFSPPGGLIEVVARRRGTHAELAVRDQGPGIADADRPHVFEQFYTADRSRRRGGTGLGLAIARRIVDAHGGTITVADEPSPGATFVLRLPLAAAAV
nr:HAMP domain-containing sensor histidine kinase [Nannocystis pusilla]